MAEAMDLGKLVNCSLDLGEMPPPTYEAIHAAADGAPNDDKDVAKKAVEDTNETPSIWFVNFPDKAAAGHEKLLQEYLQDIQDYRCWASLIWWRTVYANKSVPQDSSKQSRAKRSAYCARVASHHMKTTPWLALNIDHNVSREINCKTSQFHWDIIEAVLAGFVGVTPAIMAALEGILKSLSKTVEQSTSNTDTKTIVCERYEYIPQADVIKSYVRLVSFAVSDEMRNVEKAKKTEQYVKCTIEYNEYEATFNRKTWSHTAKQIDEDQKKAADEFRKKQTVDCPP